MYLRDTKMYGRLSVQRLLLRGCQQAAVVNDAPLPFLKYKQVIRDCLKLIS